ncbi:hypothetical protein [Arthrobacter sp. H14]|uniref:hypothetical protein n=1 Tax=Arthrobacter sp. H14 TaxID=1312959 RepID=UPI0006862F7C|nr:hypothetical protein [Arthrobacter sp. H14]
MHKYNDIGLSVQAAAFGSLGAGLIHLVLSPAHWEEWAPLGAAFVVLGLVQIVWAFLAFRFPGSRWLALVLPVNIGTIAVWAVSRLWGLPIGPAAGAPENVVVAGIVATLLEVFVTVSVASALVPRVQHSIISPGWYKGVLAVPAVAVTLLVALAILTATGGHEHTEGEERPSHGTEDGQPHNAEPSPTPETTPGQAETGLASPTADPSGGETNDAGPPGGDDTADHDEEPHGH